MKQELEQLLLAALAKLADGGTLEETPPASAVVLAQIHKKQTPVVPVRKLPPPEKQAPEKQADKAAQEKAQPSAAATAETPKASGEAATAEHERHHQEHRPERGARYERDHRRRRTRERVGENASVGGQRSDGERYAGRARCLDAFTSSRGTASGTPSRQVTTGTPTCS